MPTSLNHQPEVHHPKSPAIRWAADYPIYPAWKAACAVRDADRAMWWCFISRREALPRAS
jgi:hypothetical protein